MTLFASVFHAPRNQKRTLRPSKRKVLRGLHTSMIMLVCGCLAVGAVAAGLISADEDDARGIHLAALADGFEGAESFAPEVAESPLHAQPVQPAPGIMPGTWQELNTYVDGQERNYLLYIPRNYVGQPAPVLMGFSGWRQPNAAYFQQSNFEATAAGDEAIMIFPRGIDDAWAGAPYSHTTREQDMAMVHQVLADVAATYAVDFNRIYAMGYSNGGGFAVSATCSSQNVFAAVATFGEAVYPGVEQDCEPQQVAALVMHGDRDDVIKFLGGVRHETPYSASLEVVQRIAMRNTCQWLPQVFHNGDNTHSVYHDCARPTEYRVLHGAGHFWSAPHPINQYAWEFLSRQYR